MIEHAELLARIFRAIERNEGCSHQLCSSSDEHAEWAVAKAMRQLLCDHEWTAGGSGGTWKFFNCSRCGDWRADPITP